MRPDLLALYRAQQDVYSCRYAGLGLIEVAGECGAPFEDAILGCVSTFLEKPDVQDPCFLIVPSLADTLRQILPRLQGKTQAYYFLLAQALHELQCQLNDGSEEQLFGRPVLADGRAGLQGCGLTWIAPTLLDAQLRDLTLSLRSGRWNPQTVFTVHQRLLDESYELHPSYPWTAMAYDDSENPLKAATNVGEALALSHRHGAMTVLLTYHWAAAQTQPVHIGLRWHVPSQVVVEITETALLDQQGVWNTYSEGCLDRILALFGALADHFPEAESKVEREGSVGTPVRQSLRASYGA